MSVKAGPREQLGLSPNAIPYPRTWILSKLTARFILTGDEDEGEEEEEVPVVLVDKKEENDPSIPMVLQVLHTVEEVSEDRCFIVNRFILEDNMSRVILLLNFVCGVDGSGGWFVVVVQVLLIIDDMVRLFVGMVPVFCLCLSFFACLLVGFM